MLTVVTGASGHVGGNLIRALLKEGRQVRALVREDIRAFQGLHVELTNGDLTSPASLVRAFKGADVVYNLAVKISIVGDPDGSVHQTNVVGTRNVVNACIECGVKRLVHFSSTHALSNKPYDKPVTEESVRVTEANAGAYDVSKVGGELEVLAGVKRGLDAVIVNPSAILGPHDYKPSRMGQVLLQLYYRSFPGLVNGGYSWVDVRDVVAGAMAAEKLGRTGESYLLTGHWMSLKQLALVAEEITGVKAPRMVFPLWMARIGVPFSLMAAAFSGKEPLFTNDALDALKCNKNILFDKAAKELGYKSRPIAETIRDTYAWYEENNFLESAYKTPTTKKSAAKMRHISVTKV